MFTRTSRFLPFLLLGCGLLRFTVKEDATTTVAGSGVVGDLLGAVDLGGLDSFDVTIEQEMADQGVEPGDLTSVTLTVVTLHADPDLAFLTSIDIYVSADGVDEILVARGSSFPAGQYTVSLDVNGADLTDAVVAGGMSFRVDASGHPPSQDTDIDVHVEAEVEATAQGACNAGESR